MASPCSSCRSCRTAAASFTESTPQLYREGYDYYRTPRAQHPNSPNRYVFSSLPLQMAFFPFEQLDTISPRPLLVIAGSKADTLFWSQQVYQKAKEPKELFVVEGATHIDLYDRPQFVTPAVAKLKEFFGRHLSTEGTRWSASCGLIWLSECCMILFTTTVTTIALLASASTDAQTLVITRGGSRAVRPGTGGELHGWRSCRDAVRGARSLTRKWRVRHVRARCPHGVALASPRADPDRHGGHRPRPAMG